MTTTPTTPKVPTYSVSRLRTYKTCPTLFKFKYIDGERDNSLGRSLLIGSALHQALEDLYEPYLDKENPPREMPFDLLVDAIKKTINSNFVEDASLLVDQAVIYYKAVSQLYERAHADYTGPDPIRKGDGTVAQAPEMTSTWKRELLKLNLANITNTVNSYVKERDERWASIDMIDLVINCLKIASNFYLDERISKIVGVELEFSPKMNTIFTPNTDVVLEAYVDLVAETVDGQICVIDYKSGMQEFDPIEVSFNDQLHIYAYAYEAVYNRPVDFIGIYNLRANTLAMVKMETPIRDMMIKELTSAHSKIVSKIFPKSIPNKHINGHSPCLDQYHKPCPFLGKCYPELVQ